MAHKEAFSTAAKNVRSNFQKGLAILCNIAHVKDTKISNFLLKITIVFKKVIYLI